MEPNNVEWRKREREVQIKLTDPELMQKGQTVAQLYAEARSVEDGLKAHLKLERGRIEELEQQIKKELKCIETGKEGRLLEVDEKLDYAHSLVEYFVNSEKVDERVMDPAERQMGFEVVKADKKADDGYDENGMSKQVVFDLHPKKEPEAATTEDAEPKKPTKKVGETVSVAPSLDAPLPAGVVLKVKETIDDEGNVRKSIAHVTTVQTQADIDRDAAIDGEAS